MRNIALEEILWPKFNTLRLDSDDLDGRVYTPGINRLGTRIAQKRWDMERDRDSVETYWIEPGQRMVVEKQRQFFNMIFEWPEVFWGGSRGNAKTYGLLQSHIVKHLSWKARDIVGQTTAMFTETKVQLRERHEVLIPYIFPRWMGTWDSANLIYRFHKKFGGGVIMFLYIGDKKNDIERILSYNIAYATVDELTRQSEHAYKLILSCIRSSAVPAREWCVGSASNPGSKGHKWVNRRFVKKKERDKAALRGDRRGFIRAIAKDNPLLPASYWEQQLSKLTGKMAKAYRDGDWTVFEGQYFDMLDDEVHFIPKKQIPDEVVKYVGIDFGTNHPSGCAWVAHYPATDEHPDGRFVVYRYFEEKDKWPNRIKAKIWDRMKTDKNIARPITLSHDAFAQKASTEGYLTVGQRFNTKDKWGPSFDAVASNRDRTGGWRVLLSLLFFEDHVEVDEKGIPLRVIDKPPHLYFMDTPEIHMLFDELSAMIHKETNSDDCEKQVGNQYEVGEGDEGPDALRYALQGVEIDSLLMIDQPEEKPDEYDPMRDVEEEYASDMSGGYATIVI